MNHEKYSLYPLFELYTDFDGVLSIDKGISIVPNEIDLDRIESITISEIDKKHFEEASHCLKINENFINPKVSSLIFILSCRLLKRTKVLIRYRLHSSNQMLNLFDLYNHIPSEDVTAEISYNEFLKISTLYKNFNEFLNLDTRSKNTCYFIGLAYRSISWLESLIFFVCALETITSSDKREYKITEKFTNRINNFIGYDFKKLESIYNVRSELVHGRYKSNSEKRNIELLIIAEEVARKVLVKILNDEYYRKNFNDNKKRLIFFN